MNYCRAFNPIKGKANGWRPCSKLAITLFCNHHQKMMEGIFLGLSISGDFPDLLAAIKRKQFINRYKNTQIANLIKIHLQEKDHAA